MLVLEDVVVGQVIGRGIDGYLEAIDLLLGLLAASDRARRAIVTGAASGIGRATAERLLRDGWRVIGIDLTRRHASGVDDRYRRRRPTKTTLEPALTTGRPTLNGLVCAAGFPPTGPWDDVAAWDG